MLDTIDQWPTSYADAPVYPYPWTWSKLGESMRLIDTSCGVIYTRDNWLMSRAKFTTTGRSDKR